MSEFFTAYRIHLVDKKVVARFDQLTLDDLGGGDVVIRVHYSSINYKDALAATGAGRILRQYPLVGGIDLAGIVESSGDKRFSAGDEVLVTGCGLSETHDGGYAEYARVPGDWVIPMPTGFDPRSAMCVGTAGFTAALAIHRMEQNGLTPNSGPVVVTGASGGVGSLAIDMLAGRGYEVSAVSGKADAQDYLTQLGASQILSPAEIDAGSRPLEKPLWAGAVDNLGGELLTWLTRTVDFRGSIASIGLAASPQLNTTVLPFILRGINLLGINSSATPRQLRLEVWDRIASDLRPRNLATMCQSVELAELPAVFDKYIKGEVMGRKIVAVASSD